MTTERMTDERFHGEVDELDKQGRYARAMMLATREADRARRAEQAQTEKIRALEGKLVLVMGERDAAECKALYLERRLAVAHETIATTNDKMAEQVRQAIWNMADEAIQTVAGSDIWVWLTRIRDANAPKD